MEEAPLYGGLRVYRERGAYLRRLEQFGKAEAAYNEAYQFNPDDVRLLTGRSQVCSDVVRPKQAFADAELALRLEPNSMIARSTQARAMYTMLDFERSVVMNARGLRIRKQPPYFSEGFDQGLETIQDCIGNRAGNVLVDFLPIIKAQCDENEEPDNRLHVSRIPKPKVATRLTSMEARKHEILSRVMAMKYLGPMAYDKFFLQSLMEEPRIESANSAGTKELKQLVKDALQMLEDRQNILRSQRPYYSIKKAEEAESSRLTKYKKDTLKQEQKVGALNAERSLREIRKCLRENRIMDLVSKAERLQIFLDSRTPRNLPEKNNYTDRLYKFVGEGYISQYRISYRLSDRSNQRRVRFLLGLPTGRPISYDSVEANIPHKFTDIGTEIDKKLQQLELCENPFMRCWLYFELARLENFRKNFMLLKYYAVRCQREAAEQESAVWWLNACFVIIGGDMQQGNIHEVKLLIQEAHDWSKHLPTDEFMLKIQGFLQNCLKVATDTNLDTAERIAEMKRQRQILNVMEYPEKIDTVQLFKRISTVPAGRRFSVLPKMQEFLNVAHERRKAAQQGISVVPGKLKAVRLPPKSPVAGHQIFEF